MYLPTFARSYLFGSKNSAFINEDALSTVGGSPGLSFLYISIRPSSTVLVLSFSSVADNLSSSPKSSIISASDPIPRALNNTVTGCFLVLSTLTDITSFESVSYSSHAPLLGITVEDINLLPVSYK